MLSSGRSRTVSLGEEGAVGLERMEMEEVSCGGILQCHNMNSVDFLLVRYVFGKMWL